MKDIFRKLSQKVSNTMGSPMTFGVALIVVIGWIILGPTFDFSTTWQLFINTITTILTFLMVFLIQNTQNRDAKAMQLKLDEIIRSIKGARNRLLDLEDMTDEELLTLEEEFKNLRARASHRHNNLKKKREENKII